MAFLKNKEHGDMFGTKFSPGVPLFINNLIYIHLNRLIRDFIEIFSVLVFFESCGQQFELACINEPF